MFYERYLQLCEEAKIAPSAAATKAGFNRGTVSVWKKKYEVGMDVTPDQDIVDKICNFFGCTESWIRGISEQKEKLPANNGMGADKDMRRIERARGKMSEAEKDKMMKLLELSFSDYFSDDYKDDDLNE